MSRLLEQLIQDSSMVYVKGPSKKMPRGLLPSDPQGIFEKRILLRRGGALGDVLFSAAVASTIRARQPRCSITFACPEWIMPLMRRVPEIDQVVDSADAWRQSFWENYDYLIDFAGLLERGDRAKTVDYFQLHLEHAGIQDWPLTFPEFQFSPGSKNYIAIHVGGSNAKKKWPIAHWSDLILDLEKRQIQFVLLGDAGDDHPEVSDPECNLIGSTSILEACKVVYGAALFVGTDSGLLHFAGMARVPSFSLWGAFEPRLTLPNYIAARHISRFVGCAPCMELDPKKCQHKFRCMTSLLPAMVATKLWNHSAIAHASMSRSPSVLSVPAPAPSAEDFVVQERYFYNGVEVAELPAERDTVEVSILIPNRGTAKFLPKLYQTIVSNTTGVAYETVLCTDGDSPHKPKTGLEIVLSRSLGYAGANNRAYSAAHMESEFICLLNADVEVEPNWLKPLVDFLKAHPDVGIVGSRQNKFNGKIESLGSQWDWRTHHFPHIGYGQMTHPDTSKSCEREMITFSAVLIRRKVWEQIDGLDMTYGAGYWEDTDFCMRARQLGWKIYCVPESVVKHHVGGSKAFPRGIKERNKAIFHKRWIDTGLVNKFRCQMGVRPHKDRIVACYIVLNEEEFIEASLESIYDFVDKIIIVEGGNDFAVKAGWCDSSKRSSDRTVERIEALPDSENKIELIQGDWKTKTEQRNAYAQRLHPGDWMLLMDGDEVFLDSGIWRVSALMHTYDIIMPGFYLFWNNFNTVGTSVWEDFLQTKVVHWREGFRYVNHNCPSDASGRLIVRNGEYKKWRNRDERLYCHYSWVKPLAKLRAKAEYYRKQPGGPKVVPEYIDRIFLGWRQDPKTVEKRFGTHLYGGGETRHFGHEHPVAIARRLKAGVFDWE